MGWTSYHATHYKNGKVDRKAECDSIFNDVMVTMDSNKPIGKFEVLKSSMVGSTYYAAVKRTRFATETEPEQVQVWAVICLTSTDMKDYFNFSYKDMDESMGPYNYDCPKGILDLLTPTDSEWANNWRQACREHYAKKNNPNALNKLPLGSVIQFTLPYDTTLNKAGSIITLEKTNDWSKKAYWVQKNRWVKWGSALINRVTNGNYEVIKRGEC